VLAETVQEGGEAGASTEGHDAQTFRVGRDGVMVRRWQAVFLRLVLA
jgi:hypothetical protein